MSASDGVPDGGFKESPGARTGEGVEMEANKRAEMIKKFIEEKCLTLIKTKGDDYNQGDTGKDANSNFKRIGEKLALDPFKVWAVYFFKHIDAIETWLLDGKVKSEPIEGRIADAVNYLLILHTMIEEKRESESLDDQLPSDVVFGPKPKQEEEQSVFAITRRIESTKALTPKHWREFDTFMSNAMGVVDAIGKLAKRGEDDETAEKAMICGSTMDRFAAHVAGLEDRSDLFNPITRGMKSDNTDKKEQCPKDAT